MLSPVADITFIALTSAEFIMAVALNVFILKVSIESIKRRQNLTEIIYFFMGLANICLQMAATAQMEVNHFWSYLAVNKEYYLGVMIMCSGLIYYNFWLMAWLCAHYCVSIVSNKHKMLLWLKRNLSALAFHVPLLSTMWIMFISLQSIWLYNIDFHAQSAGNATSESMVIREINVYLQSPLYIVIVFILGGCLPLSIALVFIGMTAIPLLRHICKMKQDISGASSPNLQALTNATRTMILLITLSVVFSIAHKLFFVFATTNPTGTSAFATLVIISFYPTAEASVIIQASAKMRKLFLGCFCVGTFHNTTDTKRKNKL